MYTYIRSDSIYRNDDSRSSRYREQDIEILTRINYSTVKKARRAKHRTRIENVRRLTSVILFRSKTREFLFFPFFNCLTKHRIEAANANCK